MLEIPQRIPPHNLDAERAVLGALLIEGDAAHDRTRGLECEDFYTDANRVIFATMRDMIQRGEPIDPLTLAEELRRADQLEFVGGPAYLALLETDAAVLGNLASYVRTVKEHGDNRRTIQHATKIVTASFDGDAETARELIARLQAPGRGDRWPAPVPLTSHPAPPDFPVDVLAGPFRDYCDALAASTQTPRALPGLLILSAIAGACAGRAVMRVHATWTEPLCLYVLAILPSGSRKSSVFVAVTAPYRERERLLFEETRAERAAAHARRRIVEERGKYLNVQAVKATDPTERERLENEAIQAAQDLSALPAPSVPRLWISGDATPESVAELLIQNVRLAQFADEGTAFDIAAGRYTNGHANFDVFLHGWSATPTRVDRKGREAHSDRDNPLTLAFTVQPDVLRSLAMKREFMERGFVPRFLFAVPISTVGARTSTSPEMPAAVQAAYEATIGAMLREPLPDTPQPLRLSVAAEHERRKLHDAVEPRLRDDADLYHMREWGSKLHGQAVRIAGLLHMAEHATKAGRGLDKPISGETMARAARLCTDFLIPHARIAHNDMGSDPNVSKAGAILAWLKRERRDAITKRDVYANLRAAFPVAKDADGAIGLLEEYGWLRLIEPEVPEAKRRGRRPSPTYRVNPKLHAPDPDPANSVNSVKSVQGPEVRNGVPAKLAAVVL